MSPLEIRRARPEDGGAIWEIFRRVVSTGDTYVFDPASPPETAHAYFLEEGLAFVAVRDGVVAGVYRLRPSMPGLGSHVANASFMVHPDHAGAGIGRAMGEHCIETARAQGFEAMRFDFVVGTNERAVALWESLGFEIVGTVPGAFRHATLGDVDAHIMYRRL